MCGYYANISPYPIKPNLQLDLLKTISRRGPDASDTKNYVAGSSHLSLGHTRLAIIDLNPRSNQPFEDGDLSLVFNGEIYNHLYLRKKFLPKNKFKTTSDTETLIKLFQSYHHKYFIDELEGMFSFVIYNSKLKTIDAFRDRAGEKPMYLSFNKDSITLSSSLKLNSLVPGFNKAIDKSALSEFLRYNYIPNPKTIYCSSFKLPPGGHIAIDLNQISYQCLANFTEIESGKVRGIKYDKWWKLKFHDNLDLSFLNAKTILKEQLLKSVELQLQADVPVGTFLSGGIDSSLITSMISEKTDKITCYNIGFEFNEFDESNYARKIAEVLGLNFESTICTKESAQNQIMLLNEAYDEPFADSSQIPTMLVSKIASEEVKVILTGDCGDELFGGYNRYQMAIRYANILSNIPYILKKAFAQTFSSEIALKFFKNRRLSKITQKISSINDDFSFYNSLISNELSDQIIKDKSSENPMIGSLFNKYSQKSLTERMMFVDFNTYMTDDILCKVDRASMYYSIETRVPFLGKEIIELSSKFSKELKVDSFQTKKLLRAILKDYVPEKYFNRPKQGFGVPIGEWMKNDLKDWTMHYALQSSREDHDFFNFDFISKLVNEHYEGTSDHTNQLWAIIQFNKWFEEAQRI